MWSSKLTLVSILAVHTLAVANDKCQQILSDLGSLSLRLSLVEYPLALKRTFLSASGSIQEQPRLYVRLEDSNGFVGYGEEAPHPRFGPQLAKLKETNQTAFSQGLLNHTNALTTAALDLAGQQSGKTARELLNLPPAPKFRSVITYGTDKPEKTIEVIRNENPDGIKLKLNGHRSELDTVERIAATFHQPIVLDINGNWLPSEVAANLRRLERISPRILWIEQPVQPEEMFSLPTSIPIYADEAVSKELVFAEWYDGVVLKPAIYGLPKTINYAKRFTSLGLKITLGCHLQSCITTSASLQAAGYVTGEWVDLDTALLVANDPFSAQIRNSGLLCYSVPTLF